MRIGYICTYGQGQPRNKKKTISNRTRPTLTTTVREARADGKIPPRRLQEGHSRRSSSRRRAGRKDEAGSPLYHPCREGEVVRCGRRLRRGPRVVGDRTSYRSCGPESRPAESQCAGTKTWPTNRRRSCSRTGRVTGRGTSPEACPDGLSGTHSNDARGRCRNREER